ncbi:MAG: DUF3050 domain-containing protein [Schlesneria sp.]
MSSEFLVFESPQQISVLESLRSELLNHPLYESVQTHENLRLFMREHAFAVWDFMSLLKRLQQIATCCDIPWSPASDASHARFINEIVLGEECDEDGRGGFSSHFELYLAAMEEVEADTRPIRTFIAHVRNRVPIEQALKKAEILPTTRDFVQSTIRLAMKGQPHEVAAAFFYGREDVIPDMFSRFVESLPNHGVTVERFGHYLRRHIELDANDHGPLSKRLLATLCDNQKNRESEAIVSASQAISQRISLWDGILNQIRVQNQA